MDRSQLVVVALPAENDPVRKFSSEVEPHLTLLYLGENKYDTTELDRITQYVAFASTLLQPFMMDVESRGELGDKSADVLFFSKEWSKQIVRFRDNLLRNDLVMSAYLSAEQYPGWVPHLTMGYPETPAKKDTRDKPGFWYVNFDRIALWTGESAGPTFPLKSNPYDMEVAMSETKQGRYPADDVLAHFGVKGMKWGVRRSRSELAAAHPDSANAKATVSKLKAGGIKTLSNQELKDLNERLNLEKNYKNLVKEKKTKGQKAVEEILMNVGKQEATKILGKYAGKGIANLGL